MEGKKLTRNVKVSPVNVLPFFWSPGESMNSMNFLKLSKVEKVQLSHCNAVFTSITLKQKNRALELEKKVFTVLLHFRNL